ncbi:MAG: DUF4270 domain-containing protein [Bacteroidota bacterium]
MTVCSKDRINIPLFVLFLGLFLLVSCRKNEDTVGSDFIGAIVGFDIQSSDTTQVIAYTSRHDSVETDRLSYFMLGEMNDPEIGTTKTAIATQLDLPTYPVPTLDTATIDSIVLQLPYGGPTASYGNLTTVQTIKVYELNEDLRFTKKLYSNKVYAKDPTAIGSWTSDYTHLADSIRVMENGQSVGLAPHIRIKLDDIAFINKIKNASAANLSDTASFRSFLKGLYIVPETGTLPSGEGAIAYMNMASAATMMVIYYNGSRKAEFPIYKTSTVKGNAFSHSYLPAVSIQPLLGGTHQTTCYIQPSAGLKTRILFPYIFDFAKNKNIAITGAEVIVTLDQTKDSSVYKIPKRLYLYSSDELGFTQPPFDLLGSFEEFLINLMYYGGHYSGNGEYRFTITREVQYWFNQYKKNNRNVNYGLNLRTLIDNPVAANRAILDTRPGKIKLKLSYTVIK